MRNQRSEKWFRTVRIAVACGLIAVPLVAEDVNRIVLRVNDEIATLYDYEFRKSGEIARILAAPDLSSGEQQELLKKVGQEVMSNLFAELLMLSYAEQQGIRVSDRDVDEALADMQRQRGIESQQQLEEALAASGMTLQDLRDNVRRELIWNQVLGREVRSQVEVGDEELRAFYRNNGDLFMEPEQRSIREVIVLESSERSDDDLRSLALEIYGQLQGGSDLESVAAARQEQGLTTGVIDLGWLRSDEIGEELSEVAWSLEPGAVSPPVKARGGYHILQVVEIRESQQRPFSDVETLIARRLQNQRFNEKLREFMAKMEKDAFVREDLPPDAVGYQTLSEGLDVEDELDIFNAPVPDDKGREPTEGVPPAAEGAGR